MTVTRLTPPPPPQVEFQLTVTAEELALIKKLVGQLPSGRSKRIYEVSDNIYAAINGETSKYSVVVGVETTDLSDVNLATCARIIEEAN